MSLHGSQSPDDSVPASDARPGTWLSVPVSQYCPDVCAGGHSSLGFGLHIYLRRYALVHISHCLAVSIQISRSLQSKSGEPSCGVYLCTAVIPYSVRPVVSRGFSDTDVLFHSCNSYVYVQL